MYNMTPYHILDLVEKSCNYWLPLYLGSAQSNHQYVPQHISVSI